MLVRKEVNVKSNAMLNLILKVRCSCVGKMQTAIIDKPLRLSSRRWVYTSEAQPENRDKELLILNPIWLLLG